jgi:CheY-like chemotaxis protein
MDAIEVLRRICRTDASLPVMLITGCASATDIEEARRRGVEKAREKPDILTNLTDALAALGSHRNPQPNVRPSLETARLRRQSCGRT